MTPNEIESKTKVIQNVMTLTEAVLGIYLTAKKSAVKLSPWGFLILVLEKLQYINLIP